MLCAGHRWWEKRLLTGHFKRFSNRTLDGGSNEAVWLGSRFISLSPSSGHLTLESLSAVIWPIVPVIWGDQGWAEPPPPLSTQDRWSWTSTCREPKRTLAVIFCRIQMQQRDLPVSGENSFRTWLQILWQLHNLVALGKPEKDRVI